MANKLIAQMGLPKSIANIFAARNILTAKDALSLTEFDLMELLDVGLGEVNSAVAQISEITCPPYQSALSLMEERVQNEYLAGHLPTRLKGLDEALCGGIPFGSLTELVGPAGIGKTQFCLKLALLAALPTTHGGLNGRVIYIDVESKFSSRRLIEIGAKSFPEIFHLEGMAQEMAGRILVLRPASLSEFTESLQQVKLSVLQHQIKLIIIDSMAGLNSGEYERDVKAPRQHSLGWHISFIKSLAEFSRIPIVVTNQVRSQSSDDVVQYPFQGENKHEIVKDPERLNSHLVAALGIHWAHAVTIRLVLEADSGQRFIKVAKSPISPPLAFPFVVTSSGISLLTDDGTEVKGPEINSIHCQGQ
ncbi:AAA+ ATPase domain [Macleaya cordata]|uniref:AAA+ ATPase domain n=1 Tax=Macleaya cordata TaxID=56857 RepID=A0A200R639_MACCD|nr:AAA+ ATPase domain [Macleaya cordata]